MSFKNKEGYSIASERGAKWILHHLYKDGSFGPDAKEFSFYYKTVWALTDTGYIAEASKVLEFIKRTHFMNNGNFNQNLGQQKDDPIWHTYANTWAIIGAQKIGKFDISSRGINYIMSLQDPESGGFPCKGFAEEKGNEEHVIVSSACGLACLYTGRLNEAENLLPDYSLIEDWKASIIFSSRGCINHCSFCAVTKLEPQFEAKRSIKHLIWPGHKKVVLWDNNIMASPYWKEILIEIRERGLKIDFNQGIDARLIDREKAEVIASLKTDLIRTAFETINDEEDVERGIKLLIATGIRPRKILAYLIYNFNDSPDDLLYRLQKTIEWGIVSYPMRYQPISGPFALKNDSFIGPMWTPELLEMVADARRVLGSHGAFPPYQGLKEKFLNARTLKEALELRPVKKKNSKTVLLEEPLLQNIPLQD